MFVGTTAVNVFAASRGGKSGFTRILCQHRSRKKKDRQKALDPDLDHDDLHVKGASKADFIAPGIDEMIRPKLVRPAKNEPDPMRKNGRHDVDCGFGERLRRVPHPLSAAPDKGWDPMLLVPHPSPCCRATSDATCFRGLVPSRIPVCRLKTQIIKRSHHAGSTFLTSR
jgi:hypothetical protein